MSVHLPRTVVTVMGGALLLGGAASLAACWTETATSSRPATPAAPTVSPHVQSCGELSPQARLAPADGGYRRLDQTGASSLRTAIDEADRKHPWRTRRVGGPAFNALIAAIHDLHDEVVACAQAADPSASPQRYSLHLTIDGDASVGAVVRDVDVKRLVAAGVDQPELHVSTSARACIASLLTVIELPPSDGPGEFETILDATYRCPHAR